MVVPIRLVTLFGQGFLSFSPPTSLTALPPRIPGGFVSEDVLPRTSRCDILVVGRGNSSWGVIPTPSLAGSSIPPFRLRLTLYPHELANGQVVAGINV